MMWDLGSIAFLAASLFITVWTTVRIVEARHVASIALDQAFTTNRSAPQSTPETQRQRRHRAAHEAQGSDNNPYSARSICARVKSELANRPTNGHSYIDKETFERMMQDTDRLFTHGRVEDIEQTYPYIKPSQERVSS